MSTPSTSSLEAPRSPSDGAARQALILGGLLLVELICFSILGSRFPHRDNLFEIARDSVELGLLALAMTLVIVTGGIDLSVGSLMSLAAVLLGKMLHDGAWDVGAAVTLTILLSAAGGALNAALITLLRLPPLIVTLITYTLYGGLAVRIAYGRENPSDFSKSFIFLGNGYVGPAPVQAIVLAIAIVLFWVILHRSTLGRSLCAIGYSAQGARYAGLPVRRQVAITYILSGLCAGIAAIVAVARVDTAKADMGSGLELAAITAVVLGGTSIFGGRGSIPGTVMGFAAIVIMRNGLLMSDHPLGGEWAGILTGLLLLLAIGLDRRPAAGTARTPAPSRAKSWEELDMKNSQLAVLCGVILVAALIVTGGNFLLVRSLVGEPSTSRGATAGRGSTAAGPNESAGTTAASNVRIAMMPKSKGNGYFVAAQRGALDAAKELGIDLLWDGPTNTNPAEQSRIIDTWINRGVDVIAVACEDGKGISVSLRKAREKGIKVVTWDSDADPDARDFFVNQATPQGIGYTLMDNAAHVMGNKGEFAIITASLNATNMNQWIGKIKERLADKYPEITLDDIRPCDDQKDKAFEEARVLCNSRPNLKLIMAICSPAVPGSAEAVKQSGRSDLKVIGLGLPNDNKAYVHEGITDDIVLWNTMNLGYLAVMASYDLQTGKLHVGDKELNAGRVGKVEIVGTDILLGKPMTFDKSNIDQFDF